MSNLTKSAKQFLHNRFSGVISEKIRNVEEDLNIIDSLHPDDNFWLLWYETALKDYLKFLKACRFIPSRFIVERKSMANDAINKITKDNKLVLKEIILPAPINDNENYLFVKMLLDSILSYLLEDIDDEILYSIVRSYREGPYEYKEVKLEKGDIVIDAGANLGEFSALAGIKGCKAYAFEPMPYVIDNYLSKTVKYNPNITICQYALSDKQGELSFEENLANMASSSFVRKKGGKSTVVKVKAIDLDTYAEKNKLPSVDFIKADIEGAERYMLMGAKQVLKEFAPKIAICKYHLPDDPKVLRELILDANPRYIVEERYQKIYAYVPK